jgi:hypothetical protein
MIIFFFINFFWKTRDEKRNLRFPCIQWKREQNFVPVSTVYKGNANFVFRPCGKHAIQRISEDPIHSYSSYISSKFQGKVVQHHKFCCPNLNQSIILMKKKPKNLLKLPPQRKLPFEKNAPTHGYTRSLTTVP